MYLLIRAERGIGKLLRGFTAKPASQGLQNGDVKPISKKEQRVNSLKANAKAKMGNFESIAKIPNEVDEDSKRINFWRREEQEDVPKEVRPREERDQQVRIPREQKDEVTTYKEGIVEFRGKKYKPEVLTIEQVEQRKKISSQVGKREVLSLLRTLKRESDVYKVLRTTDKVDLHSAIHSDQFAKLTPRSILTTLTFAKKTKLVKVFRCQEIESALKKVSEYLHKLELSEVGTFASLLRNSNMLDDKYMDPLMKITLDNASKMSVRTLTNILYAFGDMSLKKSIVQDYGELFNHCQVILALHLRDPQKVSELDLVGISVAYSKSQMMNDDFRKVLESAYLDKSSEISPKSIMNLLHCFALDKARSDALFRVLCERFNTKPEEFDQADLVRFFYTLEQYRPSNFDSLSSVSEVYFPEQPPYSEIIKRLTKKANYMNLLDIKLLVKCLVSHSHPPEHQGSLPAHHQSIALSLIPNLLPSFYPTLTLPDIADIITGLEMFTLMDNRLARKMIEELKYRLKVCLRDHKPQGMIDSMKESVNSVSNDTVRKTFLAILNK
jgi:hypothetical protein